MKKFALTTLAVMAAVGVLAVQPADAKKVQQDPSMALIDMPMNDEIQQVNGVSKSANKETQRLSNKLADATRVMVKKNWKTIYIKAVPTGDKVAVRFYYTDKNGQVYNGQVIRNTGLSKGKKFRSMGSWAGRMQICKLNGKTSRWIEFDGTVYYKKMVYITNEEIIDKSIDLLMNEFQARGIRCTKYRC